METLYRKVKCSERLPEVPKGKATIRVDTNYGKQVFYGTGWANPKPHPTWWLEELPNAPVSESRIDLLCPWHKAVYPTMYDEWTKGFNAALKELNLVYGEKKGGEG